MAKRSGDIPGGRRGEWTFHLEFGPVAARSSDNIAISDGKRRTHLSASSLEELTGRFEHGPAFVADDCSPDVDGERVAARGDELTSSKAEAGARRSVTRDEGSTVLVVLVAVGEGGLPVQVGVQLLLQVLESRWLLFLHLRFGLLAVGFPAFSASGRHVEGRGVLGRFWK